MRRPDIAVFGIGVLTIAFTAFAQEPMTEPQSTPPVEAAAPSSGGELTPDQMTEYEVWSEERRTSYDGWPLDTQAYFWTLAPQRKELFWKLSDADRVTLSAMGADDQEATWRVLEARVSIPPAQASSAVPPEG